MNYLFMTDLQRKVARSAQVISRLERDQQEMLTVFNICNIKAILTLTPLSCIVSGRYTHYKLNKCKKWK